MTSVLSTINPLFQKNQTLTRSIYTDLQRSFRSSADSAPELASGADRLAFQQAGGEGTTLAWTHDGRTVAELGSGGVLRVSRVVGEGGEYLQEADLAEYEKKADAESTYETKANAQTTYLAKADAATTYLAQTDAASTYLSVVPPSITNASRLRWGSTSMTKPGVASYTGSELSIVSSEKGQSRTIVRFLDSGTLIFGSSLDAALAINSIFYTRIRFANSNSTYGYNDITNVLTSSHLTNYDTSAGDNLLYTAKATQSLLGNYLPRSDTTQENRSYIAWTSGSMTDYDSANTASYTASKLTLTSSRAREILAIFDNGTVTVGASGWPNANLNLFSQLRFCNTNSTYGYNSIRNVINSTHLANYDASTGDQLLYTAKATEARLANYLTTASAASDYLTKAEAASTYATVGSAGNYLTKEEAASDYLSKTDATDTYLTTAAAAGTYLTQSAAAATYLTQASAPKAKITTLSTSNIPSLNKTVLSSVSYSSDYMVRIELGKVPVSTSGTRTRLHCYFTIKCATALVSSADDELCYSEVRAVLTVGGTEFYRLGIAPAYYAGDTIWYITGSPLISNNTSSTRRVYLQLERTSTANTDWTLTSMGSWINRLEMEVFSTQ